MFLRSGMIGLGLVLAMGGIARAGGTSTDALVEYAPGVISSATLQQNGNAAIGLPASADDGQTSPFTPPFHASSITIVGAGGHITLHFAAPVIPIAGPDIGVFTNTGLVAKTVNGAITAATSPSGSAAVFSTDAAIVSVSENNNGDWIPLNGGNPIDLTMPSNAFVDATLTSGGGITVSGGVAPANPYEPFTGTLAQFAGLTYPQMQTLLNGSFGGAWIDASASGLPEINYIRFDVPTGDRLVLDAVTAADAVPEPGSLGILFVGMAALAVRRRRRSFVRASSFRSFSRRRDPMKTSTVIGLAAVIAAGVGVRAASAAPFVMNGTTYQVEDVAGAGSDSALLELDFGTNAAPQEYLFGYQWDPSTSPSGRDMLLALQNDAGGLTFTDVYYASYGEYLLNTLGYQSNQPPNDYPNSFWLYFTSADGQTWTATDEGYDQQPVTDGGFFGWALQTSDPNEDIFNPPFLPPSHFPGIAGTAVPEPATLGVMTLGAAALWIRRRRV